MQGFQKEVQSSPACCPGVLCRTRWRCTTCPKANCPLPAVFLRAHMMDGALLTHRDETGTMEQMLLLPCNSTRKHSIVMGDRTTTAFLSHRQAETLSYSRVIRSYVSANSPLLDQGSLEATCSSQGTAGITAALSLRFKLLTQNKTKTKDGHKLPTQ